jgi:hypothetical protein
MEEEIMSDHSLAEKIAADTGSNMYLVWWTYHANYHDPVIIIAKSPEDAFKKVFPSNYDAHHPDFKKYTVHLKNGAAYKVLP